MRALCSQRKKTSQFLAELKNFKKAITKPKYRFMHFILFLLLLFALIYGPSLWVQRVMAKHNFQRRDFPGTAGELLSHLIETFKANGLRVETDEKSNHYDPRDRTIRLTQELMNAKSLTAIVAAAHEFGHAMQHAENHSLFILRNKMAYIIPVLQKVGSFVIFAAPIMGILTKAPHLMALQIVGGICILGSAVIFHLVTLPVEWDASFQKAMPLLVNGGYISLADEPAARQLLTAAALTYVAGSLSSLLNLFVWLRMLR